MEKYESRFIFFFFFYLQLLYMSRLFLTTRFLLLYIQTREFVTVSYGRAFKVLRNEILAK